MVTINKFLFESKIRKYIFKRFIHKKKSPVQDNGRDSEGQCHGTFDDQQFNLLKSTWFCEKEKLNTNAT